MKKDAATSGARRAILAGIVASVGARAVGWWPIGVVPAKRVEDLLLRSLPVASAATVGKVAATSLSERGRSGLVAQLLRDLALDSTSIVTTSRSDITQRISRRIREDFALGRTVIVADWTLSETEVRLSILAARRAG